MASLACRNCSSPLTKVFADLGNSPLSNAFLTREQLSRMEPYYPLCAYVCDRCFLVQLPAFESPQAIFEEYAYFSSYSQSWLEHARAFAEMAIGRFRLAASSQVIEVASNDGYLLQYFKASGIPVLGVEPARNVADAALARGIPTVSEFLGRETARRIVSQAGKADLVVGNNVLAHVPDLHDFVAGLAELLKPGGTLSLEFPHLLQLAANAQFDTIYHEHFSYFSLATASDVLSRHDLQPFDVEELPTHGGSLRVFAAHRPSAARRQTARLASLVAAERAAGLDRLGTYAAFAERIKAVKRELLSFLIRVREDGKAVVGYGAPAKGNTLLTYCGIRTDLLDYTVDRNPYKQGRYLPGSHIPVYAPERIAETKPDYVLILPWNLREEIVSQLQHVRQWGGKFVVPIPRLEVIP
jgi:SAM-dependent methyltransferase